MRLLLALALVLAAGLSACDGDGGGETPTPSGGSPPAAENLLVNPGLEDGPEPWLSHTRGVNESEDVRFSVSGEQAHSGGVSALLRMRDGAEADGAKVYYLVQEVTPAEFPESLSGYYRVEGWQRGTLKQYLQFVVIVFAADNNPVNGANNHQIRYLLAGIDSPPFGIGNARFVFLNKEEPRQGEWVPFQANIREDFERLWGEVPEGYDKVRVLFEVRWDDKAAGDGAPQADVFYDDLYVGPAVGG